MEHFCYLPALVALAYFYPRIEDWLMSNDEARQALAADGVRALTRRLDLISQGVLEAVNDLVRVQPFGDSDDRRALSHDLMNDAVDSLTDGMVAIRRARCELFTVLGHQERVTHAPQTSREPPTELQYQGRQPATQGGDGGLGSTAPGPEEEWLGSPERSTAGPDDLRPTEVPPERPGGPAAYNLP